MEELFRKFMRKDEETFEQIVKEYEKQLIAIATIKLKDSSLAYDAVQETFISLYLNYGKIKDKTKLKSWLAVVLMNNCNRLNNKKEMSELSFEGEELENKISIGEEEFEKIFNELDFISSIDFLSEEEREIITMYYSQNYTAKDISNVLNLNEGTIKSKLSRARVKIKNKFGGENNEKRK